MTRQRVNTICAGFPGASVSDPWGGGHDAWKVGGKMFANIGALGGGVSVKCATIDDALHLEDLFGWPKAPYFHRSWVLVPFDVGDDELRFRLEKSYGIIRAALPAKVRAELAPFDQTP